MDFSLSDQQQNLQQEMFDFAQANFNQGLAERDKHQLFDRRLWSLAGSGKIPGLCIPKEFGGKGLDPLSTVIALESFAEGCEDGGLCFALAAHLFACAVPIWLFGSKDQQQQYLPKLCDGSWIAANAMTEAESGSDSFQLGSSAVSKGEGAFELNGKKNYVSNAPQADWILSYMSTDAAKGFFGGISCFILSKTTPGLQVSPALDKTGVRTCHMAEIDFEKVVASESSLLGKVGGGGPIFNHSMQWERVCLGAIHLGAMNRLLKKATRFVKQRRSGNQMIGNYQAVSHQLAELSARLEAARLLSYQSAWKLGQSKNVGLEAASTKLMVSELFKDFALKIFQIYAGQAYSNQHEADRVMRDALGSTIYSGTSEVQKNIIAKLMGI